MKNIVKTSISFLVGLGVGIGAIKAFKTVKQKLDNKDEFEPEFEDDDLSKDIEEDMYEDDLDDESFNYPINNNLTEDNQSEEDTDI